MAKVTAHSQNSSQQLSTGIPLLPASLSRPTTDPLDIVEEEYERRLGRSEDADELEEDVVEPCLRLHGRQRRHGRLRSDDSLELRYGADEHLRVGSHRLQDPHFERDRVLHHQLHAQIAEGKQQTRRVTLVPEQAHTRQKQAAQVKTKISTEIKLDRQPCCCFVVLSACAGATHSSNLDRQKVPRRFRISL